MPSWIVCREVRPRGREVEGPRAQLLEMGWFERSGKSSSSLEGRGSQHPSRPPPGRGLEIHVDPPELPAPTQATLSPPLPPAVPPSLWGASTRSGANRQDRQAARAFCFCLDWRGAASSGRRETGIQAWGGERGQSIEKEQSLSKPGNRRARPLLPPKKPTRLSD